MLSLLEGAFTWLDGPEIYFNDKDFTAMDVNDRMAKGLPVDYAKEMPAGF